ncbi:MAG: PAS domain-containing protein [Spirochaetes bacterium]|nr:PAS domain-containing protein [Spirochaetota bacterium]
MQESFASFWLSRMALVALVVYVSSAIRLWALAPNALANRLAALLCADLAVWALQAAISYAADDPAVTVALSRAMSWSWPLFPAIALHFAIEISADKKRLRGAAGKAAVVGIYALAAFLAYMLAGPLLRGAVRRAGYWSVDVLPGPGYSAFSAYYLVANLLGMFLVARNWFLSKSRRERSMLGIIVVTHAIALAGGFTTDTVLEALGVDFPKVGVLWAGVWAVGLNIAMERYGFLAPFSPRVTGLLMDRFIERSMDGIAISDSSGRVIYWNDPLATLTGIPAAEAIGVPLRRLQESLVIPDPSTHGVDQIETMARLGDIAMRPLHPMEFKIMHRDGKPRWLQTSAFTIPSAEGEIWAFILRDVTRERRSAEEALERLRRQGHAQKMEALGSLAGGIAHDFNNVLGGIVGATSMIDASLDSADGESPVDISRELDVIRRSVKRATSSVRGLMAFTTDTPRRHEPFSLEESARRMSEFAGRTMGRSIRIRDEGMARGAVVVGDAPQMEQLILNLLINAEHSMTIMRPIGEAGGGVIGLSVKRAEPDEAFLTAHPDAGPGPYWALSVSDEGVGMDERALARAFDPFYTTKDPEHGSGLGLSMVHLIARQHDGFVEASSEPGAGSTFTVYLPAAPAGTAPAGGTPSEGVPQ